MVIINNIDERCSQLILKGAALSTDAKRKYNVFWIVEDDRIVVYSRQEEKLFKNNVEIK